MPSAFPSLRCQSNNCAFVLSREPFGVVVVATPMGEALCLLLCCSFRLLLLLLLGNTLHLIDWWWSNSFQVLVKKSLPGHFRPRARELRTIVSAEY